MIQIRQAKPAAVSSVAIDRALCELTLAIGDESQLYTVFVSNRSDDGDVYCAIQDDEDAPGAMSPAAGFEALVDRVIESAGLREQGAWASPSFSKDPEVSMCAEAAQIQIQAWARIAFVDAGVDAPEF